MITPISPAQDTGATGATDGASSAPSASSPAFGLDFQSLLQIILTQLTYQDPLKPMDNFEFVSQLAQFSQLQQTQALNTTLDSLLASQSTTQALGLLGHTVAVTTNATTGAGVTGTVTALSLTNGGPSVTVKTSDGQTLTGIAITQISTVQ